jgi:hypothetical protein
MHLTPDHGSIEAAVAELKIKLPIAALSNIIDRRVAQHKPRGLLRRRLEMLRAIQLAEESA